jgi:Sec7-like guanine-nucleotide exchange factor
MDLFAGLSLSGSPAKPAAAEAEVAPNSPPAAPKSPAPETVENGTAKVAPAAASSPPPVPLPSAPLTDKLLGLLGTPPTSPGKSSKRQEKEDFHMVTEEDVLAAFSLDSPPPSPGKSPSKEVAPPSPGKSPSKEVPPPSPGKEVATSAPSSPATTTPSVKPPTPPNDAPAAAAPSKQQQQPQLAAPAHHGSGVVHPDTPIPNSDVALSLFRKFALKTRPRVPYSHGGTQRLTFVRFIFGSSHEQDVKFNPYKELMEIIAVDAYYEDEESESSSSDVVIVPAATSAGDSDPVVDAILGQSGDTMAKARMAVASFCHLLSVWGHASAHMAEAEKDTSIYKTFSYILSTALDTATALVTHGCLDGVLIGIGPSSNEYLKAVDILAESVFCSDLSLPQNELSATKFLLSTGCRVTPDGHAMLRGTHLLQTIRVLYHVYLSTATNANKTTARASLQQLVTSVFIRMIASSSEDHKHDHNHDQDHSSKQQQEDEDEHDPLEENGTANNYFPTNNVHNKEAFPTENHRDAFLVLRSLCKLSMRSPPADPKRHSHVGLHSSGSNTVWDGAKESHAKSAGTTDQDNSMHSGKEQKDQISLIYTQAIHPALESKILALDLLLYVLQNTEMVGNFLQICGPQFHYAIRNYLCVSLLKNCTSGDTRVVQLSLMVFVPIIRNFRSILKTEIEAFVTNVFFVILDSKNSPIEHKSLVVTLFQEICSDPTTLAEIFLNYDCDLSAVDLFHRIVNTLSKVSRTTELYDVTKTATSTMSLVAGAGAARMEKMRSDHRELRLDAMRALRQVLASLHASIVEPMPPSSLLGDEATAKQRDQEQKAKEASSSEKSAGSGSEPEKQTLVQIYDSKKKRRHEESEVVLRFRQKPTAGIAYAAKCGHLDGTDPGDVARYLLKNKDLLEKTQIGEYLGREVEYQGGFALKVLHEYVNRMDFCGLMFDDAIRFYLSGFRLPGEAQKIDRIMEKFAERYTAQNPEVFPTADVAFILAFSIIMLNTDLHNPAIKEDRRMTKTGFVRNNRGIADGLDLPEELLLSIFDRIQANPISLKEDDDARERVGDPKAAGATGATSLPSALNPSAFFNSHYDEMDRTKESNFNKERDQIVRTTESLLKRRRHTGAGEQIKSPKRSSSVTPASRPKAVRYVRTEDSGLRDEYVSPMFEVTWGPALAAFSTAMESANGSVGALLAIATDKELEQAAENAAETIEVCLTGFRFAICTAGLCGNDTARDSYMLALSRFSQLGTGIILEPRHIRCTQTMLALARSDGELLGCSWEHIFKSLSEINRFHQLFQVMARNDRVVAHATARRKARLEAREKKQSAKEARRTAMEASESLDDSSVSSQGGSTDDISFADGSLFSDEEEYIFEEDMDTKEIDEANARTVYEAVSESLIEAIYERSSSLSTAAVKEFVLQLCRTSRMEISNYGGHVGSGANEVDLTEVHYLQHHTSLLNSSSREDGFHLHQTNIYNMQKLVEVTHYNMESRPRLVFADLWTTVAAHLTSTALHSNPAVAMYAVDSFRQLSIQYLQREELEVFEFQRRFLKPLETVMSRSELSTTKELLLKCVERIILMFGSSADGKGGMLRSGWRPILTVLGLAGRDSDEAIARLGFDTLTAQLQQCLALEKGEDGQMNAPHVLLAERFVDLVDALLIYVSGEHEEMSLVSIDHLVTLAAYLGGESFSMPLSRRKTSYVAADPNEVADAEDTGNHPEFELWWPILLGISRSIGDSRKSVQIKSLEALLKIVTTHFLPSSAESTASQNSIATVQTLQLIFRGILTPVLEFGEVDASDAKAPQVPDDFERFLSAPKPDAPRSKTKSYWLDTTFDQFMDGCIGVCLQSIDAFHEDTLVEEIFAMLNTCLLSDSGALAIRGLRRLEQFVTSDLKPGVVSDDTWATVSHMLRRCLALRNLPRSSSTASLNGSVDSSQKPKDSNTEEDADSSIEDNEAIREFVMEENILANRRYIGGNAINVIGSFLGSERFAKTLGLRWRLFLVAGVGKTIREWEQAAAILTNHSGNSKPRGQNP